MMFNVPEQVATERRFAVSDGRRHWLVFASNGCAAAGGFAETVKTGPTNFN